MGRELIAAFDRSDADDDVRAVIVTGAGRGFCAGADLGARRRDVRLPHARAPRARRAARQRRPVHAARVRLHQARDRRDQRARGGSGRDHDAADGRAARLRGGAHGLRVHAPRHRPRGLLQLVPAARRRDQPGDGMGGHRARVQRAGGARARPRAQRAPARRAARRRARARARDRREHRARVGRARSPADVADARRRAPDARAPRRLARHVRARSVRRRRRGRHLVPREAPRALPRPRQRRAARRSCRGGASRASSRRALAARSAKPRSAEGAHQKLGSF